MMKLMRFITLFILVISIPGFSQLKTFSFAEAEKLSVQQPKPYFVFITADWCKFCKMMEKSVFTDKEVIKALNEGFYFIVLDVSTKSDIVFNGSTFRFKPSGVNSGAHELALELANINGETAFPAIAILSAEYSVIGQQSGFIDSGRLLSVLKRATGL